jgi:uncharacterized membrane protein
MTERTLRSCIAALACAGLAVAGYLTYARYSGTTISCTSGGCETVQSSPYATVLGIPIPVLGLLGFAVLMVTACSAAELARAVGAVVALAAFTFSAYLLYVQLVLIEAVCDWCLVSDAVVTAIVPFAVLRLSWTERDRRSASRSPSPGGPLRAPRARAPDARARRREPGRPTRRR